MMDNHEKLAENMMKTNLFKGMTGESLSKEQYAEWKKLRRQVEQCQKSLDLLFLCRYC